MCVCETVIKVGVSQPSAEMLTIIFFVGQADGTRSGSLSVAIAAFRSFASHPDQRLAAASQQALAGCGAVLYPRAAPLHLPHAVTSQARAWGGSSASSTGRGAFISFLLSFFRSLSGIYYPRLESRALFCLRRFFGICSRSLRRVCVFLLAGCSFRRFVL